MQGRGTRGAGYTREGLVKKVVLAGIDVSAAKLDAAIDRGRGPIWEGTFENTPEGHRRLVKVLRKKGAIARVVLEATGVYHLELALALHGALGVEVMVANPRATRDFARSQMRRSKTDRTDARSLLEFVRRMPFVACLAPSPEILALRPISRRITALTVTSSQDRNRRHAVAHCRELPASGWLTPASIPGTSSPGPR